MANINLFVKTLFLSCKINLQRKCYKALDLAKYIANLLIYNIESFPLYIHDMLMFKDYFDQSIWILIYQNIYDSFYFDLKFLDQELWRLYMF